MCVADINWYGLMCCDDICSVCCIIIYVTFAAATSALEKQSIGHRLHRLVTRREFVCRHLCGQPFDFLSMGRPLFQIPNFIATSE